MTHWLELLVDEELRDIVEEEAGAKITETVENPFALLDPPDWTDVYRGSPYTAKFRTEDGKALRVRFWLKVNPSIGEPYENPLTVDEERLVIVAGEE